MGAKEELEHERHIATILKIRQADEKAEKGLAFWLNSTVVTTLIGLAGTLVGGGFLSAAIQDRAKRNEADQQTRAARQVAQNETVIGLLDSAGMLVITMDDVLASIHSGFAEKGRRKDEVQRLRDWKVKLNEKRDEVDVAWRRSKGSLSFRLHHQFGATGDVLPAWKRLEAAGDAFQRCTEDFYGKYAYVSTDQAVGTICAEARAGVSTAAEAFGSAVRERQALDAKVE
jgi:hypothetical protein